jgi:hypothetical protein
MAHIDPAFVKQIFDIAQRERKPDVEHHRETDNFYFAAARSRQVPLTLPHRAIG